MYILSYVCWCIGACVGGGPSSLSKPMCVNWRVGAYVLELGGGPGAGALCTCMLIC